MSNHSGSGRRISRRAFIKTGAAAAAGAAALTAFPRQGQAVSVGRKEKQPDVTPDRIVPTYCEMCFWRCGVLANVKNGKVLSLEGQPDNPLNMGRLCARGQAGVATLYDPNRLKAPAIRTGPRGTGHWRQASWGEALDYVALRLARIRDDYGPEANALFFHGKGGALLEVLYEAMGSPNIAEPSFAQCRGARDIGFQLTFGEGVGSPERLDFPQTKLMVFFGSHLGENAHNSQVQEFVEARDRGAGLIVVDPRFSVPAGRADLWLQIKPATDLALLLALIRELLVSGTYDKAYVERHCVGLDELRQAVDHATPEWAAAETDLSSAVIRQMAAMMALARPAVIIHPGRHVAWYGDDTQRARAMAILVALLGAWGAPGGMYKTKALTPAKYPLPPFPHHRRERVDQAGGRFPFATLTATTGIRDATLSGKPYPIKSWFVSGTNLFKAMPDYRQTLAAIDKLDLIVANDIVASEVVKMADVILPECSYLERYDELNFPAARVPFVSLRQPVVPALYDTKPAWLIAKELARRLALDRYFPWGDIEEYLDVRLQSVGTTLAQMKETGILLGHHDALYFEPGQPVRFATASGKIELSSQACKDYGFDAVPTYTAHEQPPAGMFRLVYGRNAAHTYGRMQNNQIALDIFGRNPVWIHPEIASVHGLSADSRIRLINADGIESEVLPVKITERIRRDCVYMVHGFAPNPLRIDAPFTKCACDSALITTYREDPLMGGTGMRVNFVRIRKEA